MRLFDLRAAIVKALQDNIVELIDVAPHGGRFTAEELKRFSMKSPAARVSLMGLPRIGGMDTGQMTGPAQIVIYLVTRARTVNTIDILDLSEKVAAFCVHNQWGLSGIEAAKVMAVENLYSSELDGEGVLLWAVALEQALSIGTNYDLLPPVADDLAFLDGLDNWPTTIATDDGDSFDVP